MFGRKESVFTIDKVPFDVRLTETIEFCAPRASVDDPVGCLRIDGLRPFPHTRDRGASVVYVADSRHSPVYAPKAKPAVGRSDLLQGRLLVYFPDLDLSDGAAEAESRGFLDVYNSPPWATWIAHRSDDREDTTTDSYLISWVPPCFVDGVSAGIRVNPEECILWLEDADVKARVELRRFLL
jgi:hypothetical protein